MNNTAFPDITSDLSYCDYSDHDSGIGGAIFSDNSSLTISSSCVEFVNNSARNFGGAMAVVNNSTVVINGSICFDHLWYHNMCSPMGISFDGNSVMATAASHSVHYNEYTPIYTSNCGTGGAIYAEKSKINVTNCTFMNNNSSGSGGAVQANHSDIIVHNVNMINNSGSSGGSMRVVNSTIVTSGDNLFRQNHAKGGFGGAILIDFCVTACLGGGNRFENNCAGNYGGALDIYAVVLLTVSSNNHFKENEALYGGAVGMYNSTVHFCGENVFEDSRAFAYGGALSIEDSRSSFNETSRIVFHNNRAQDAGGAITSYDSQVELSGDIRFESNTAEYGEGGAMALYGTTKVILNPFLNVSFIENRARSTGGAIFFADSISAGQCSVNAEPIKCFLVINTSYSLLNSTPIALHFINNMAAEGGTVLYGGQFDKCKLSFRNSTVQDDCRNNTSDEAYNRNSFDIFEIISTIEQNNSISVVSSPAKKICICNENSTPSCDSELLHVTRQVMPGQEFKILMAALGQNNSTSMGRVYSKNISLNNKYQLSPAFQSTSLSCASYRYRLYADDHVTAKDNKALYKLFLDGACQSSGFVVFLNISIQPCPVGFKQKQQCVCEDILKPFTQNCYIDSKSISRSSNTFWVAQTPLNETPNGFVLHTGGCPFDYCKITAMNVTLDNPNVQCDNNHSGTLCGNCEEEFSLALGSLHCLPCDHGNFYFALIIPFALAGIALVVVLFILRLTVAAGSINGLIYYANIVQANHQAFFPRDTINFFTVFIAWLNLDLGIETCFYSGMDIYAYSWLQFLFPFYLWCLIVTIIISSHYSQRVAKSFGQNPVAVLDTLLLMSYNKILKAIIVPLSPTSLMYVYFPNNSKHSDTVWLYGASLVYFKDPRHIVLGIFAIFTLLFLFLPYTFLLLSYHWLQAKSNWPILSWINKIKPFMDAYHAPYRKNKRHWIGLFLLTRCALFLTFALNAVGDHGINLLVVCSVIAGLSIIKGRVYESRHNDFLESSFILNLWIFSVATLYVSGEKFSETDRRIQIQHNISGVSVGTAFVYFIGIVTFHTYQRLKEIKVFHNLCNSHMHIFRKQSAGETNFDEQCLEAITDTTVSLRELLLDDMQ